MRIWSLHPSLLDSKGLVALWRETLLAKRVLEGRTHGYRHHPQLIQFRQAYDPVVAIQVYLAAVHAEALSRNSCFDQSKFGRGLEHTKLRVTEGQLHFERNHLLAKLAVRDPVRYGRYSKAPMLATHPLFHVVKGGVEPWEVHRT